MAMMKEFKEAGFEHNSYLGAWIRDNYQETIEMVKLEDGVFKFYNTLPWSGSINYSKDGNAFSEFVYQCECDPNNKEELLTILEL